MTIREKKFIILTLLRILNKKIYHFEQHVGNFEIFLVVQCYVINVPTCIFLPVRLEVMLNSINFKLKLGTFQFT